MTKSKTKFSILTAMLFALLVVVASPGTSLAQGDDHGRGHGRGHRHRSNWEKKHDKFVNGHDARDGRWDGRGPARRNVIVRNGVYRNGVFVPRGTQVWNRNRVLNANELRLRNERARLRLAQRRAWLNRRNR